MQVRLSRRSDPSPNTNGYASRINEVERTQAYHCSTPQYNEIQELSNNSMGRTNGEIIKRLSGRAQRYT